MEKSQCVIETFSKVQAKANVFRFTDRQKYVEIIKEFYKSEMIRRYKNLERINSIKTAPQAVLEFVSIRENIVDWMVDWCWTYDPRNPAIGLPATIPWIPWPRQIEFIE